MDMGEEIKVWEIPAPEREPLQFPVETPEEAPERETVPA